VGERGGGEGTVVLALTGRCWTENMYEEAAVGKELVRDADKIPDDCAGVVGYAFADMQVMECDSRNMDRG
jgi:hypothetical protein